MAFTLLGTKPGVCPMCAVDHPPTAPHNQQSLHWQYYFYGRHNRWPTWADAMAHCDPKLQEACKKALIEKGAWTVNEGIVPIPMPPESHTNEPVEIGTVETVQMVEIEDGEYEDEYEDDDE